MKRNLSLISMLCVFFTSSAQQNYCNFEGIKFVNFGFSLGQLDTLSTNPAPDSVNGTPYCAKYIRDTALYDVIKIYPFEKLENVTPYVNNTFQTPKIRMKVFTSAPPGTKIELQLGLKSDDMYPSGIHSEYVGATSVQNAWQVITFHYFYSPPESNVGPDNIDKIVILFEPGTNNKDTFYFDDLSGPELLTASAQVAETPVPFRLFQNSPNPVKDITYIKFHVNYPGHVSLKLYDMIGNQVLTLADENMKPGSYSVPLETGNISEGIYFYTLKKDGVTRSMKLIVSK